jgi:hypothetical protein
MAPTKSGSADDIVSSLSSPRSTHPTSASVNKAFRIQLDLGSLQISQHTSSCGSSTSDAAAASATADCPLFTKLPTELLATICDLVAEDESRPVLRVEIKQDATTQQKHPHISAFVVGGLSSTCRQLRHEYSAALKRRIELFGTRHYGDGLRCLMSTTTMHSRESRDRGAPSKALQIYASAAHETQTDKGAVHKIHALTVFVPIEERSGTGWARGVRFLGELAIVFVTDGSKSQLSPSRISLAIPAQPLDGYHPANPWPSLEAVAALDEIKQAVRGTQWAGNMRCYLLWFDYVARYTKDLR